MEDEEEIFYEMATVRPATSLENLKILLAVNPDENRYGEPYFKMYNASSFYKANKVWRISFLDAKLIKNHKGKIQSETEINNEYKDKLINYLKLPSRDFFDCIIWDELKYRWNLEHDFMNQFTFKDYKSGKVDNYYKNIDIKGSYVPYSQEIPNYINL